MMLPMLVSSAQRFPWPSCSMPSLERGGKKGLLNRRCRFRFALLTRSDLDQMCPSLTPDFVFFFLVKRLQKDTLGKTMSWTINPMEEEIASCQTAKRWLYSLTFFCVNSTTELHLYRTDTRVIMIYSLYCYERRASPSKVTVTAD